MARTIAVHGSYFANNFGDTLLVELLCDMVAQRVGGENVHLAVPGLAEEQAAIGYPVLAQADRRDVDLLLFAGGGYFGEPPRNLLDLFRASRKAYRRHLGWIDSFGDCPKGVIGVGVGPLTFGFMRRKVKALFRDSRLALVRDAESMAYCRQYGFPTENLRQCVDMALCLPPVTGTPRAGVALHAPNLSPSHLETILRGLAGFEGGRYAERLEVIFDAPVRDAAGFRANLDAASQAALGRSLPVRPYSGHRALRAALAGYELVITSKLHVGIATIAQGGRVISTPHHPKTPRLYRQLGLSEYCLDLASLTPAAMGAALARLPEFAMRRDVVDDGVAALRGALDELLG